MIRVLVTGKLKERHWVEGEAEYLKRLKDWWRVEVVELPGSKLADEAAARREEESFQLKALEGWKGVVVALSEDGKWTPDSVNFSRQLAAWRDGGRDVVLVIGGASGLGQSVKDRADKLWTLGKLTMPHQMVRVVLAEQIYRAMTLDSGHPYHRA